MIARYLIRVPLQEGNLNLLISPGESTWLMAKPFVHDWKRVLGGVSGRLEWDVADRVVLFDRFDRRRLILLRFRSDTAVGARNEAVWALNLDEDMRNHYQTSWECLPRPMPKGSGTWVGVAGKGAFGALVGSENAAACVWSIDDFSKGKVFWYSTTRFGAVGGWSGGISLCVVTGVRSDADLSSFACSGDDWAFAIGSKVKALGNIGQDLVRLFGGSGRALKLAQAVTIAGTHQDALVNLGKLYIGNSGLDPEATAVSFFDLPGPGVEAGKFWYWAAVRGVKSFQGAAPTVTA